VGLLKRRVLRLAVVATAAVLAVVSIRYVRDIRRAYDRLRDASTVIPSPFGDIEFAEAGSGTPVLVVHGSGGGFDQGALLAEMVLGDGFHWIAPSRFGYLRSTLHEGATFDEQAHAYAHLLDARGIDRVAIVTISHGGPSALLFAALHPERVSSLTLISAGVAASSVGDQAAANRKGDMLVRLYRSDALYWAATSFFRRRFMELMGANEAVIDSLTPEQRDLATRLIDFMNPASPRADGAAFDNKAAMPNERIAGVRAPTLVIHAADDALQLFHNAEFAAATIPNVQLQRYERGGHLLMVVERDAIRAAVQRHILEHDNR